MKNKVKVLIAKIQTLPIFGLIIKLVKGNFITKDKLKFTIEAEGINYQTISTLYFAFYESPEIRFVKKHLRTDLPIIELGTSLGVISTYCRVINKNKLVCVEANPILIPAINKNFQSNEIENYSVINAAIGYSNKMFFETGPNNVLGKLSAAFNNGQLKWICYP